jgi:hypothetical protein
LYILLSRLCPYLDEIIGENQCGFECNRSTADQISCIHQILEKKNGSTVKQYIGYSRLQEWLRFSEEGNIVHYSHRVLVAHKVS